MSVTADSTLWTADTHCVTADGRIVCIEADVHEAAPALDQTDAAIGAHVLFGDMDEPGAALDQLDADVEVAGGAVIPVDVVEAAAALDQLDADVFPEIVAVPGGAYYPRRRLLPVIGVGYGILPQLEGEAHGVVGVVGAGVGTLPGLLGEAAGSAGVVGRSAAQLGLIRAMATGAGGTRGAGEGTIVKFSGSATGRHDDDEAAVIAFLLAA